MKILILYASAGAGHKKAAEAVYQALGKKQGLEVDCLDVLDLAPVFFRFSYPRIYLFAVNRLSWVWGLGYYILDNKLFRPVIFFARRIFNWCNSRKLEKYLLKTCPDVIVSTHFLPPEVVVSMKRRLGFKVRQEVIITDLWPHYFWVFPKVDSYLVGTEATRRELIRRGIQNEKIKITGIPINPLFNIKINKKDIREQLGLDKGLFTVLIAGGGFGVGPIRQIAENIDNLKIDLQVMVVCGHNKVLLKQLKAVNFSHKFKIFGFINNMHELMPASDVIISKSGGLTVSESMAKNLPMIVIKPIPGQETKNSQILESYGAALRAGNVVQAVKAVKELALSAQKLEDMKQNTVNLAHPDSARQIAEIIGG